LANKAFKLVFGGIDPQASSCGLLHGDAHGAVNCSALGLACGDAAGKYERVGEMGRLPASKFSMLRTRREGGACRTRPLDGESGRTVISRSRRCTGPLASTAPTGMAETTGTAETVVNGALQ